MAQGACMALEDAVTLGEALRVNNNDWPKALDMYKRARVARTARIVLSGRRMANCHAKGVERLVLIHSGRAAVLSASMTRWNGCMAGT